MSYFYQAELTYFDNDGTADPNAGAADGGAEAAAAAAAAEAAAAKAAAAANPSPKKFSQTEVNEMVGKRNKALQDKFVGLEKTYTDLLEQSTLTTGVREQLEADLKAVQAEMRTKEQQLEFEKKTASDKFATDLTAANEDRDEWQTRYEKSTIDRAITDAALSNDGYNGEDFIAHLGPKARVIDELDVDGKKTGRLVPRITWEVTDEVTKEVTLVLKSPDEVVKLMKESHQNLFKSNVAKGIGGGTAPGQAPSSGEINQSRITTEEYMELAKTTEGRQRLGLPPLRM